MQINDLVDQQVDVLIEYFDIDKTTLLKQKTFSGVVTKADEHHGFVIAAGAEPSVDAEPSLFKLPPLMQAFSLQMDGSY